MCQGALHLHITHVRAAYDSSKFLDPPPNKLNLLLKLSMLLVFVECTIIVDADSCAPRTPQTVYTRVCMNG